MTTEAPDIDADGPEGVAPHEISVLVWDGPSPARTGAPAAATVGVACSRGCSLAGQTVEIRDAGVVVGWAVLGEQPAPGAEALHSAVVRFTVPDVTGPVRMTAGYMPDETVPHEAVTTDFGFRVDPPADHEVKVQVRFEDAPLAGAEVWMGHYVGLTDAGGEAVFHLPKGAYTCSLRKLGYDAEPVAVEVTRDLAVRVVAGKGETREELEARLSAWESYPWS